MRREIFVKIYQTPIILQIKNIKHVFTTSQ